MVLHKLYENPEFASENSVKAYKWSANMSSFYTTYKYIYIYMYKMNEKVEKGLSSIKK